jgi:hypothetical protein
MIEEVKSIDMGGSEHRERRLYAAVLSLVVTVTASGDVPLVAQVSTGARNASCL